MLRLAGCWYHRIVARLLWEGHGTATVAQQPVTVAVPRLGKDEVAGAAVAADFVVGERYLGHQYLMVARGTGAGAAVAAAAAVVLLMLLLLLLLVQGRGRLWMNNEYHRQWCRPDLG